MKNNNIKYQLLLCMLVLANMVSCKKPDLTVLPPPGTTAVNTVMDYLKNQVDLSLFAAAVEQSGLADSIAKQEYTVLAINNKGFNNSGIYTPNDLKKWEADSLLHFVKMHILAGRVFYNTIPRALDTKFVTINGETLLVSYFSTANADQNQDPALYGDIFVNGVEILANPKFNQNDGLPKNYGVSLLNGIVYQLPTAIKTTNNSVQKFLNSRAELSLFVAALKKFKQWDRLATTEQITVYAPPNSVFLRNNIDADSIARMNPDRFKPVFMDCYILGFNRVFTTDVRSFINISSFTTPFSNPTILMSSTSDRDIGLVMLGGIGLSRGFDYTAGCFLFDNTDPASQPNHSGGITWPSRILGSNAGSDPVVGDPNTGYIIPYMGEYKLLPVNKPKGTYMNYNCANGVVHYINGLLIMPDEANKL